MVYKGNTARIGSEQNDWQNDHTSCLLFMVVYGNGASSILKWSNYYTEMGK